MLDRNNVIVIKCSDKTIESIDYLENFARNCYELMQLGAQIVIIHEISGKSLFANEDVERFDLQRFRAFLSASKIIQSLNNLNLHAVGLFGSNSEMIKAKAGKNIETGVLLQDYVAIPKEVDPEILFFLQESKNIITVISPIGLFEDSRREILIDANIAAAMICNSLEADYLVLQEDGEIQGDLEEFIDLKEQNHSNSSLIEAIKISLSRGSSIVKVVDYKKENNIMIF